MAEDVNIVGRGYDEDLCENHFFKYMQTKHKQLYEEAAKNRWTICIPRHGTQARGSFTQVHVENHILRPEVQVRGQFIVTTEGFHDVKSVQILFEETFFNKENQSFAVLCIEQPLEGGIGSKQTQQQEIDNILKIFNSSCEQLEGESLRHLMTYVMDKLHDQLFKGISSIVGKEDVLLNKTTRNLADIQVKDLGVKEQLCPNLPRGKRALSSLNKYKSPLEKFHCLKKVVTILTDRKMKSQSDAEEAITVDDFLPALIFLVIKSDIPNWLANITFLHNFHFSMRGQNEFQFFLSSIEAAVEHIRGGSVNDIRKGLSPAKFASNGNEEEIGKLLSEPGVAREKLLCHPLCSCDKCEKLHIRSFLFNFKADQTRCCGQRYGLSGNNSVTFSLPKRTGQCCSDVNAPDNDGNTPLHLCTANGHEKCTKAMIHFDMQFNVLKVNAANEHGDTPLHLASRWGYADIVRLLLENGASLEARNKDKSTPLDSSYNKQVTEILLVAIAKASEEQEKMLSSPKQSKSVTKHPLTQAQKFPKPTSKDQEKAKEIDQFMRIVAEEDVEMVRFKLGSSDDEEDEEDSGERPHSEQDLCHPLCQCDKCKGMTPLHVAAIRGFDEMTSLLLRRGARTDVKNYTQRRAPLHFACQYNHPRVAGLLLSHQAKENIKDYKGNTPLHLCCFAGHLDPAVILLGHGAGINATNDVGDTPLHVAARFNLVKHVILFVENGASVTIRNKKELTPLQCAQRDDVIRALDQAEGFNYNARRNKLTYSDYRSHNSGYIDSKTPPNHRSNLVPTHSNSSAAKKQPFSVPSPSDPTRVAQFRDDSSAEALKPHERLNKLFERLEKGHVERLQDIGKALSIHHFDHSSLRKVQTRDHSQLITRGERVEVMDVKNEDNGDDAST
ncbi:Ankyrin repeat domain-containing protein 27 [Acropora cervicornis]|uniref:Ankyrin repeat domain-containing protein 27 n=1 Tax=Acropora cervicornis TaxID=6130 RepID=A0AAD9QG69_ACRCE|nr:Ankyrin repeat domain-containing protein 27 [Acropora cervicornis]